MPFPFLSHQAAVLPLKILAPRWFSGTALAAGSIAPDLESFLLGAHSRQVGHTLPGQLLFCTPLALALVWILHRVIAGPLGAHLPDLGPFHLRDYRMLARRQLGGGFWWKATGSVLLGSFSHVAWDELSSPFGWAAPPVDVQMRVLLTVGGQPLHLYEAIQHGHTLLGILVSLAALLYIGRHRLVARWYGGVETAALAGAKPTAASRRVLWGWTAAGAALGLAAGFAPLGWGTPPDGYFLAALLFRTVTFTFAGLCIACARAAPLMRTEASGR